MMEIGQFTGAAFATYLHGIEFPRPSCSKFKKTEKGKEENITKYSSHVCTKSWMEYWKVRIRLY